MYLLIYDDRNLNKGQKQIISVHSSRSDAEKALILRQNRLGKRVYECNTRIVWSDKNVSAGETIYTDEFVTWHPDEKIPVGELYSDAD